MSIHSDPRRNSLDEEEYREWQNDLRMEYAKQEYYDNATDDDFVCGYMGEDGSCNCDRNCSNQTGKWKDTCGLWKEKKE